MTSVVIHYQELALKGRNRPWFINTLVRTIRASLVDLEIDDVRAVVGRIVVRLRSDDDWPEVRARLARLPGVANFSSATHVVPDVVCSPRPSLGQIASLVRQLSQDPNPALPL